MITKNAKYNNLRQINISKNLKVIADIHMPAKSPTQILKYNDGYKNINDFMLEFLKCFRDVFQIEKSINLYFKSIKYKSSKSIYFVNIQITINEEDSDKRKTSWYECKIPSICYESAKSDSNISGDIKVYLQDEAYHDNIYILSYTFDTKEMHIDSCNWIGTLDLSKDVKDK